MRAFGLAKDNRTLAPTVPRPPPLVINIPVNTGADAGHFDGASERSGTSNGLPQLYRHGHYRGNARSARGFNRQPMGPSSVATKSQVGRRGSHDTTTSWKSKGSFLSILSSPARKISRIVQRALGGLAPFRGADSEQCPICYDTLELSRCFKLDRCQCHYFCIECMIHFLSGRIGEGRVKDLRCPLYGVSGCSALATENELNTILDKDVMKKYYRFLAQQNDPSLRECPKCLLLVAPSTDLNGQTVPEMMCKRGCITFCYYHSLQHVGRSCDEYGREQANIDRMEEKILEGNGKKCPICGIHTEKFSGCNQMTCAACHRNWCWVCEEDIEGRHGWHYNPLNPRACLQFDDSDDATPEVHRGWLMIGIKICALPAMIATTCLFLCACMSMFLCPLFILPLVALMIAWVPVAVLIHFCFIPFGADERHINFLLAVPFSTFMAEVDMVANLCSCCLNPDAADDLDPEAPP